MTYAVIPFMGHEFWSHRNEFIKVVIWGNRDEQEGVTPSPAARYYTWYVCTCPKPSQQRLFMPESQCMFYLAKFVIREAPFSFLSTLVVLS